MTETNHMENRSISVKQRKLAASRLMKILDSSGGTFTRSAEELCEEAVNLIIEGGLLDLPRT